ncbi:DUF4352 domain-containing protein [Gracilibacillus caseinilyticus]|uniref:DUF4352 domain-containing protein n=1 Tax=Gracilibacillus caseinilyticus TaxID=2932256 RepID=A0ABY4EZU7_9BACI|nr:DUF4352 domain-containing protein [Gracilibacillus caseinilyticus]UOQ49927.1 DUF4352 domain-containing protein [Gracilibacillus caseinilyticus]
MMKYFFGIVISIVILTGCSGQHQSAEANTIEEPEYLADYVANPQVPDDRLLQKAGQSTTDEKGTITLKKLKQMDQTYTIGDMELTIQDVKLIHLEPDESLIDYFHVLTHEKTFDYIKMFVEITNTAKEKRKFAPVALFETDQGEKISWEKDIYLERLNDTLEGSQSRSGNIGFIVKDSEQINQFHFTTSTLFDQQDKKIAEAKKIEIKW